MAAAANPVRARCAARSSTVAPLDPERLPPEGVSFNWDSGALAYNVGGTGAVLHLTPADAWTLAQGLLRYVARSAAVDLEQPHGTA